MAHTKRRFWRSRAGALSPQVLMVLCGAGLLFSLVFIGFRLRDRTPPIPVDRQEALGTFCAREIAQRLKPGAEVALIRFDVKDIPAINALRTSLTRVLKEAGVEVVGEWLVPVGDSPLNMFMIQDTGYDPMYLKQAQEAYPQAKALISLVGLPWEMESDVAQGPPLILIPHLGTSEQLKAWLHKKAVLLAFQAETEAQRRNELAAIQDLDAWTAAYYHVVE